MQNLDLFDLLEQKNKKYPLASKMRPATLDEIVGQQHIVGKGKLLYRVILADKLSSIILYGPPGTGKTTLAKVIVNSTNCIFRQINATNAGKKNVEEVVKEAKEFLADIADGDARAVLNALELAQLTTEEDSDGYIHITLEVAEECIQKKAIRYDGNGDNHYDAISAFIESMKHTEPDATLYYFARMLVDTPTDLGKRGKLY